MNDYILNEAIRYAIEENEIYVNYIEGDSIKRVIKDVDFYYNGMKYFITLEVINNVKAKGVFFHRYLDKNKEPICYYSFKEIIGTESEDIDLTIKLMMELSEFTIKEMQLIEVIRVEFIKKLKQ